MRFPCLVAALIFAIVAALHAWRWWVGGAMTIDGTEIPQWVSVAGFCVTGFMSYWLLSCSLRR